MGSACCQNRNFQPHLPCPFAFAIAVAQLYPCTSPSTQLLERSGLLRLFIFHRKKANEENYNHQILFLPSSPKDIFFIAFYGERKGERSIDWLPPIWAWTGGQIHKLSMNPDWNWTHNPLVTGQQSNPLSHSSQGPKPFLCCLIFEAIASHISNYKPQWQDLHIIYFHSVPQMPQWYPQVSQRFLLHL